jgi:uncharacterized protein (DUF2062 family)
MPRQIAKNLGNWVRSRRDRWYLRIFGERIAERHLWSLSRRSVTAAFGAGVAIAFVPLPTHTIMAVMVALIWRLNLPVTLAATWVINPLTLVPGFYGAYRLGAWLLHEKPRHFKFELSWQWLEMGLGPRWKAFLLGCLICAVVGGVASRLLLDLIWRAALRKKYRARQLRRASS